MVLLAIQFIQYGMVWIIGNYGFERQAAVTA
jgi:hypothetical protein